MRLELSAGLHFSNLFLFCSSPHPTAVCQDKECAMAVFRVLCRRDAFIDYVAEVEAEDAETAAILASDDPDSYEWDRDGEQEFDAKCFVTLDGDGSAIGSTERGEF